MSLLSRHMMDFKALTVIEIGGITRVQTLVDQCISGGFKLVHSGFSEGYDTDPSTRLIGRVSDMIAPIGGASKTFIDKDSNRVMVLSENQRILVLQEKLDGVRGYCCELIYSEPLLNNMTLDRHIEYIRTTAPGKSADGSLGAA